MKKILVVDDTKNIRLLLSKCLETEGFEVFGAKNSIEALDLIKLHDFEITFIDIKMPNVSGTALLEEIRALGYTFPVVIMTAFGTIKNAIVTTKLGAKAYLQKPFTANTIRKTLSEVFSDFESAASVTSSYDLVLEKIKALCFDAPLNPETYLKVSELLSSIGEEDKSKAFKEFSLKL